MRLLLASISRRPALRSTMNDLLSLTRSFIHGAASKLSPMAISQVVPKPESMSSLSSKAESSTMSRWLLTNVYRPCLLIAEQSISQPSLTRLSNPARKL